MSAIPELTLNTNQRLSNELAQSFTTGGINLNLPPKQTAAPVAQGMTLAAGLPWILVSGLALFLWWSRGR
jgi:hypothetical protein